LGSVRDLAAAFNREPDLVRKKVESVHINIGNSTVGGTEWNVMLDPQAYRAVMESGLPIFWYPCSPYDVEDSTFWLLDRFSAVFGGAPRSLQSFFLSVHAAADSHG
jgi:inosine-uridine nucleoside N-ribohydrolase